MTRQWTWHCTGCSDETFWKYRTPSKGHPDEPTDEGGGGGAPDSSELEDEEEDTDSASGDMARKSPKNSSSQLFGPIGLQGARCEQRQRRDKQRNNFDALTKAVT